MPSLCPLPSAVNTGGVTASGGELEEDGLCFSFGHSGTLVEKQVSGSKASELAFGHPRCKAWTPPVFACQKVGKGWGGGEGVGERVQIVSTVPFGPTGTG